ncbi:response regulator transcription factor [Halarcobacter ebronensis]|uniref:Two-component system response regulator n=1 Tax=Halarcobacter ebronensis TaxID=1462615 RepID=A0A4Q1ALW9_9BACT|nr:response regulator transcription factor [Halarcobacter ebronensis]RXK04384.1 two-component system response regulator [Halarcobacter ebronensis]
MIDKSVLKKLSKIRVLIVEDDDITAYALKQSLEMYCKRVDTVYDGLSGFEYFKKNSYDIVVTDINLPELDGLEMIQLIHEISPHTPVITITSYDNSRNILGSLNQRVYTYLRKPINIEELQIEILMATKDVNNSQVALKNGFTYDKYKRVLTNSKNKEILLTKTEKDILHLLISNLNNIVSYSSIECYVWQEKSMSIEALRMRIKEIRHKTYCDIIENISGCGYRIKSSN